MANIRQELTSQVAQHEQYIRLCQTIQRGQYGDYDWALGEMLHSLEDWGVDTWEFNQATPWFVALVWRQAKCNYYEEHYDA